MDTKIISGGAGLITGVVLTASMVLSSTSTEPTVYKDTGRLEDGKNIIQVVGPVCETFKFVGTVDDMVEIANSVQKNLDTNPHNSPELTKTLEKYKTFFIENSEALQNGSADIVEAGPVVLPLE